MSIKKHLKFVLAMVMLFVSVSMSAQTTVKGTVKDTNGEEVIGATILEKGTKNGTTTDLNGHFTLKVSGKSPLVISYVGMKTQEVSVAGKSSVNVTMQEESTSLNDIVVIGYGTIKKRDLTGAVTSVSSEDIVASPVMNPMESLQGKVAGLDITKESGQAGSGINLQLRGNRTISGNGNPLFIIDGMPGDYNTLNPNDIESVEVLKDASSTAIYGSSGANGVIIITTKSAKEGKLVANFNAYLGINGWSKTPEMMSGDTFLDAKREAMINAGTYVNDEEMFGTAKANYYQAYLKGQNIDWAKELLKTGVIQNYSLSLSGGTEKTKAYMSLNFANENGQYKDDEYKVYSSNIRVDHKINNFLSAGVNTQISYVHQNKPFANIEDVYPKFPYGSVTDENGEYVTFINDDKDFINPLINNKSNYRNQSQNFRMYFNPYIRVTPLKGLTWESRVNASITYSKSNSFQGKGSYNYYKGNEDVETATRASISHGNGLNYKWENILTYNFKIKEAHEFTLTGVTSWYHNRSESDSPMGVGITENTFLWYNLGNSISKDISSSYSMSKGMAYIGRINYSFLGRYLLSASMRWDGASVLADGHKWASFPAFSVGWRVSDEKFMASTRNWLDNLKVRVSYGETGNGGIEPYTSETSLEQSKFTLGGQLIQPVYLNTQAVSNRSLQWERSKSWNFGIDANFFNSRINLVLDYYITNTNGVFWSKKLPVTNGAYSFNTQYYTNVNLAKTRNSGIEVALNTRNIETKDFSWSSALTFSYNKEEIKGLASENNVVNGDRVYALGHAVNEFYHYKVDGVWQEDEAADAAIFQRVPGDLKIDIPGITRHVDTDGTIYYTKVNADGQTVRYDALADENLYTISSADMQPLGHNSPDWSLGFKNTLEYKGFDLSIYMYMRWGQMIKYNMLTNYDPTVATRNFPTYFLDKIGSYFPVLNANKGANEITEFSGLAFVDGSFFKIKNISLGYTFPKNWLSKAGIERMRIYGTITNPVIVAKSSLLKDYDPEQNGNMNYPLTKQLVFGVNISF
ncbi:MAG: TonB-dependent receptor [Prevotellaceae bacterium]|nr:TonB-dependent receptor [Prevotellaceae bacterium]